MKIKIIHLFLLLASSLCISSLICLLLNYQLFDINQFGFQLLAFSIIASSAYSLMKNSRIIISLVYLLIFSAGYAYFMSKTSLLYQFGNLFYIWIYSLLLCLELLVLIKLLWQKREFVLKNLAFSILGAFFYLLIHLIFHQILTKPLEAQYFLRYFGNGFLIYLVIGSSLTIADLIKNRILTWFDGSGKE